MLDVMKSTTFKNKEVKILQNRCQKSKTASSIFDMYSAKKKDFKQQF